MAIRIPFIALALFAGVLASNLRAEIRVETEIPRVPQSKSIARADADPEDVRSVVLGAPGEAESSMADTRHGTPIQVGFARAVGALSDEASTAQRLAWKRLSSGGQVAALSVTSPGAAGLRLGLRVESLPEGAVLRFHAPAGGEVFAVSEAQVQRAGVHWSPVVENATAVMEIAIPPGARTDAVRFSIPRVSHLATSAARNFAREKSAFACTRDAACFQGGWGQQSSATARMVFTRDGSSFVCSGTLLADQDTATVIPYFLTANHCIRDQADASTIQTYWFLRAAECGGSTPGPYQSVAGGGSLLYAAGDTDTAFLRLHAMPPAGAAYAGWFVGSDVVPLGTNVTSLHHAGDDLQKISFGQLGGYGTCDTPDPATGQTTCRTTFGGRDGDRKFMFVVWQPDAITQPGSSGAGLFVDNNKYLVGQLFGGATPTCADPKFDAFGRFDLAYFAGLFRWLSNTVPAQPNEPADDYSDLWWNASQSGWGVSIVQHPSKQLFAAWYVYGDDGQPLWVVMSGGTWTSSRTFLGDLYTTRGPDPTGPFNPALVSVTRVGSGTFTFDSSGSGSLAYTVNGVAGVRAITRQPFGTPDSTPTVNYGDLWWNPQESGWGVSISQQNRTLFAVWYSYDATNKAVWYVMSGGTWTSPTTYTGALYRTARPASSYFGSSTFDPAQVTVAPVGSLTFDFASPFTATMSYLVNGVSGSKSITRQPF